MSGCFRQETHCNVILHKLNTMDGPFELLFELGQDPLWTKLFLKQQVPSLKDVLVKIVRNVAQALVLHALIVTCFQVCLSLRCRFFVNCFYLFRFPLTLHKRVARGLLVGRISEMWRRCLWLNSLLEIIHYAFIFSHVFEHVLCNCIDILESFQKSFV